MCWMQPKASDERLMDHVLPRFVNDSYSAVKVIILSKMMTIRSQVTKSSQARIAEEGFPGTPRLLGT